MIARILSWVVAGFVATAVLLYLADSAVWRVRDAHGAGRDSVTVSRLTVSSLKGSKEEYDFDGTDVLPCARSLFPMSSRDGWKSPCWWLRRHRQVVTRY